MPSQLTNQTQMTEPFEGRLESERGTYPDHDKVNGRMQNNNLAPNGGKTVSAEIQEKSPG